jgi:hypothetical protein
LELLFLLVVPVVSFLVGRWWIAWLPGLVFIAVVVIASVLDNYVGSCTRSDGCGLGPVAQALLLALIYGAIISALSIGGVLLRRRLDNAPAGVD